MTLMYDGDIRLARCGHIIEMTDENGNRYEYQNGQLAVKFESYVRLGRVASASKSNCSICSNGHFPT